jgi:hypothetical protein
LTKIAKVAEKPAAEMSRQERWAVFFRYYADPARQALIREIQEQEEAIAMADEVVQGFTQEEIEYLQAMSRHKYEMDIQIAENEEREREEKMRARILAEVRAEILTTVKDELKAEIRVEIYRELEKLLQKGISPETAIRMLKTPE